ncbi:MAG TPA: hypothetical protein VIM16_11825 [Mucilaginibacter sp.]|jgi:hypothetical protein
MKAKSVVMGLTIYLVVYALICDAGLSVTISSGMLLLSPFLLVWGVYSILKDDRQKYPELKKNEEWGYRDKARKEIGG